MPTESLTLHEPPRGERARELWLQHAAGRILFEDVRGYALEQLGKLSASERAVAQRAVDHALYGVMMVADGVTGQLMGPPGTVSVHLSVRFEPTKGPVEQLDLFEGDGMCMGYHAWMEGDWGKDPVVE
jgi:hypothetical protein